MAKTDLKVGDKVTLTRPWCADRAYVGLHGTITAVKEPQGDMIGGYIQVQFEVPEDKKKVCYPGENVKFPRFADELKKEK